MKKTLSMILILTLLLSVILPCFAEEKKNNIEIIFSENFEGDLSRWQLKDNKATISEGYKEEEYIGNHLLVLNKEYSGGTLNENYVHGIKSPEIDIVGGEQYTVAADMKGAGSQKGYVYFIDSEGLIVDNQKYLLEGVGNSKDWSTSYVLLKAPESAVKMYITLECAYSNNSSNCYYDNVIVCKGFVGFSPNWDSRKKYSPIAIESSITYIDSLKPAFYENFEDKIYEEWTYENSKSKARIKRDKDVKFTGEYSLIVNDDIPDKSISAFSPYFDIEGGAEYKLSADIYKNMTLQKSAVVSVIFYSLSDSKLGSIMLSGDKLDWYSYSVTGQAPDKAVKAKISVESDSGTSVSYIDNIMVVKTKDKPIEETKSDKLKKSSIVLFVGSANALVNGEKTLIDKSNDKVIATIVDSRTLVPVRFIAENFGAEVGWDDATRTVTLTLKDKTVKIVLDKAEIDIDGKITTIDVPAQSIEGRTMLPLRAFVENVMGKKIFWDQRGLIVITDTDMLDAEADKATIDALIENIK